MNTTRKTRKRGLTIKPEAPKLMEDKIKELGLVYTKLGDMYEDLADKTGLSSDCIRYVFSPKYSRKPQKDTIQTIATFLGLNPRELVEDWFAPELPTSSSNQPPESEPAPLNQSNFQNMLDKQRDLTANILLGSNLSIDEVYVPLGLVERKRQALHGEPTPENGSALYGSDQYEVTRQFEGQNFLEEVLGQGNSPNSQGRRIAIIGEPGSGKTTRLQQITRWLMSQPEENYVIWVSLGNLQEESLEDYLLQRWLKSALLGRTAPEEYQDALIELFNQGKVWLLLDGLDEMGFEGNINPLAWVAHQLEGWIASAKVVHTCRLYISEESNKPSSFEVYRNLDFADSQRDEFIGKFIKDEVLAARLIEELNQPGKERIRDLVKNPLLLTLICLSWQNHQGALPKTRAGLYRECVEAFYDWYDKDQVVLKTTDVQRTELNRALGELAKKAIDRDNFRFRLTEAQVREFLGHADEGLFKLALDVGWLNEVGLAEEDPSEKIYAFLHPSFQEYFAALVIDDSKFFLDHVPENPDLGAYRIFEQQWKEVFLIWLSGDCLDESQKRELVLSLLDFQENIEPKFFFYHAYLLGLHAVCELSLEDLILPIIYEVFKWILGYDIDKNNTYAYGYELKEGLPSEFANYHSEIAYKAISSLKSINSYILRDCLERIIFDYPENYPLQVEFSILLLNIDPNNKVAINFLMDIIVRKCNTLTYDVVLERGIKVYEQAMIGLERNCKNNQEVIDFLFAQYTELLNCAHEKFEQKRIAEKLWQIQPDNQQFIQVLEKEHHKNFEFRTPDILDVSKDIKNAFNKKDFPEILSLLYRLDYNVRVFLDPKRVSQEDLEDQHFVEYQNQVIEVVNDDEICNIIACTLEDCLLEIMEISGNDEYSNRYELDADEFREPMTQGVRILNKSNHFNQKVFTILERIANDAYDNFLIFESYLYLSRHEDSINYLEKMLLLDVSYTSDYISQNKIIPLLNLLNSKKQKAFLNIAGKLVSNPQTNYEYLYKILWYFSEKVTYPEFYKAWHSAPTTDELPSLQPSQEPNFLQLQTDSLNQEEDPQKLFRRFNIRLIQALPATLKPQFKQRLQNCQDIAELEGILIDLQDALPDLVLLLGNRQPSPQLEQLARQLQDIIPLDWNR